MSEEVLIKEKNNNNTFKKCCMCVFLTSNVASFLLGIM